jgi:hypothetical protein
MNIDSQYPISKMPKAIKSKNLVFRVTEEEKNEINSHAKALNLTVTDYLKRQMQLNPSPIDPKPEFSMLLDKINRELGRIGNNINQISRAINTNLASGLELPEYIDNPDTFQRLAAELNDLKEAIRITNARSKPVKTRQRRTKPTSDKVSVKK